MRLKLCICFILLTLIAFSGTYSFAAESAASIELFINNSKVTFTDAQPFINSQGRTMVPLRMVSESFGAKVEWNEPPMHITITNGNRKVEFSARLSENYFSTFGITDLKTDKTKGTDTLDSSIAPVIISSRSYVPLRTIGEGFGFKVNWDGAASRVDIDTTVISDLYARNPALYDKYYMIENELPDFKIDKEGLGGDSKSQADRESLYNNAKGLFEAIGNINYGKITPNQEKYGVENVNDYENIKNSGGYWAGSLLLQIDNNHNAVDNTIVEEVKFVSTPSSVKVSYIQADDKGHNMFSSGVVTGKLQFIFHEPTSKKYLGGFSKPVETEKWYETDVSVYYTYGRLYTAGYGTIVNKIILGKDWTEIQN